VVAVQRLPQRLQVVDPLPAGTDDYDVVCSRLGRCDVIVGVQDGQVVDGSDGTRTRDLRRDRPAF
jgi:hypothetical protein